MAVKRIFRYLKGTINLKLSFQRGKEKALQLYGYCDADHASDPTDRKSVTGYVFIIQDAAISWNSKKQQTIALSTTEAEYMSMSAATQEAIWLRGLHNELFGEKLACIIHCDNKGAIHLANTTAHHPRTKHIDLRHHFIRDNVAKGVVKFDYVKTAEMLADFLTKPVNASVQTFGCNGINLKY